MTIIYQNFGGSSLQLDGWYVQLKDENYRSYGPFATRELARLFQRGKKAGLRDEILPKPLVVEPIW